MRGWGTGLLCAFAMGLAAAGGATAEDTPMLYYGHTGEVAVPQGKAFTDFVTPTETHTTGGIQFNLYYEDVRLSNGIGFDGPNGTAARARMRDMLDYVADVLNESGTLDVHWLTSQTGSTSGFLAQCGSFYSLANGINQPSSMRRLQTGTKPFTGFPEIQGTVNFSFNWNFTTGATPGAQVDFVSVLLHEVTHGLGIAGLTTSTGASAFAGSGAPNARTPWDRLLVKAQGGTDIINASGAFVGNVSDLTSADLFFEGANATTGYNQSGDQPGIYAPSTFANGSSLSHWDTGNIVGGAVMEHAIAAGVDRREYSGVDLGGLVDVGWADAAAPLDPEGEGEGVAEGEGEGAAEGEGAVDPPTVSVDNNGDTYLEEGDTISLAAVVEGGTATGYQWTRNGVDIPTESSSTFEKNNVTQADSGSYRVRVEYDDGSKAFVTSDPVAILVVPVGGLPVAGGFGLAAAAIACAFAGSIRLRNRK